MFKQKESILDAFEAKVTAVIVCITVALSVAFFTIIQHEFHQLTINELKKSAQVVYEYVDELIDQESFEQLNTLQDENHPIYTYLQQQLNQVRSVANIRYLYTAKRDSTGRYIYVVDGLSKEAEDFRHVGDQIEEEIIPDLERSLTGESVLGDEILQTEWGVVYVTYFPVHGDDGSVIGAIGMEFDAEELFYAYQNMRAYTALVTIVIAILFSLLAIYVLKKLLKRTEDKLLSQDKLLLTSHQVAYLLLGLEEKDFGQAVYQSLKTLGESLEVDRVRLWRNVVVGEILCFTDAGFLWQSASAPTPMPIQENVSYDFFHPLWKESLGLDKSINGVADSLHPVLADFIRPLGIQTLAIIPIFLQGDFWGSISVDNCHSDYCLNQAEENILRSSGMMIAAAIMRHEVNEKLIEAREEAQANAQAKSDFLSRMSHEIRTPMNAITGMIMMARKTEDLTKIKYCLDKIQSTSKQLLSIINDVLDMSKIEANKLEITQREFDFEKMMQTVLDVVQLKADEKDQHIRIEYEKIFDHYLVSDDLRLSQVLINLLTNAIKFTPEYGEITVKISYTQLEEQRSELQVEVSDSGIGITAEDRERLFELFEQADGSTTRRFGGTGLGLAICRNIITLMGGKIWVDSEPGKGSKFCFNIPVAWGTNCLRAKRASINSKNLRILVVEENQADLAYFAAVLKSLSLESENSSSITTGLEKMEAAFEEKRPYQIIFLAARPEAFNDSLLLNRLQKITQSSIVVLLTNLPDWTALETELGLLGINHFLAKPVLPSVLLDTLVTLSEQPLIQESAGNEWEKYSWQDKRLLLAEDVEINREIILNILEETKIQIDCATNGVEAVELFSQIAPPYDLILMDIQMPEMDGLTATQKIRALPQQPEDKKVAIVAMTANAFREDVQKCLAAGMDDHVAKPIDVEILLRTLAKYLQ